VSGFGCQETEVLNPDTLHEITLSWNSEPQNIEQEISNDEVWSRCAQSFFKNNNDRIPYFDIRYSLFGIRYSLFRSFFFDLTGRSRPEVALKPDT
jgi:hypothetical protein